MTGSNVTDQSEVIGFLRSGDVFPDQEVETVETHGAVLFLGRETALKIKRAVRYDYMDLSTLEKREETLRRELEINRPAAPMIYRDMLAVTRAADGSLALGGQGAPVEWVLRMWRFPRSAELVAVAARGDLDTALAERLGRVVHDYHARCPVREVPGARLIADILDELDREFADMDDSLGAERIARFHTLSRQALAAQTRLLDRRGERGHVRRAHGDLHLRNIVVLDGEPVPFDALEFDETLATCDVLYDLAFLLMDLWQRGLRQQANAVLARYLLAARGAEDGGAAALPLFQAVRAAIRAMTTVQTVRASGADDGGEARAYLDAALTDLAPAPPALVAVGGYSGTGKTGLARALAPRIGGPPGAVHLRTDTERKAMAAVGAGTNLGGAHYTAEAREQVYRRLVDRAEALLSGGCSVVFDATFLDAAGRDAAAAVAASCGVPFTGLWLEAPEEVLVARVSGRRGDASDADAEVVRRQLANAAPPDDWQRVDASGTPGDTLRHALAAPGLPAADAG